MLRSEQRENELGPGKEVSYSPNKAVAGGRPLQKESMITCFMSFQSFVSASTMRLLQPVLHHIFGGGGGVWLLFVSPTLDCS